MLCHGVCFGFFGFFFFFFFFGGGVCLFLSVGFCGVFVWVFVCVHILHSLVTMKTEPCQIGCKA